MKNFGEQFLHQKDSKLHTSELVKHEKARKERNGEKTSEKPADKISDWLKVIEKTHMGHSENPEVLERVKEYYHKEHVIKIEDIPEATFILEQRIARERGHGTIEITDEFRQEKTNQIINDQKNSLNRWINYLSSLDYSSDIPMWAKYWAFNSVLKMGKFEKQENKETKKETAVFKNRTKDTVASFAPLNPLALRNAITAIESKLSKEELKNISTKLNDEEYKKLLSTESFSRFYTQFLIELPEYSKEGLRETQGEWKVYKRGSQPDELVKSLEGYPLEWCTANPDTARTQLQGGDFHVYYSFNNLGEAKIPRVAIRMKGNSIAEVRGIASGQNMDPYIGDVVSEKMTEFPDGEVYKEKTVDMKRLTELEEKIQRKEELTKEDLRFLYQIDSKIQGFGQDDDEEDPRIREIVMTRDAIKDAQIIFEYSSDQVAQKQEDVTENTKLYIGKLFPGIFQKNIEHIFTDFPDGEIKEYQIDLNIKTGEEYENQLSFNNVEYSYSGGFDEEDEEKLLNNIEPFKQSESLILVSLAIKHLGFQDNGDSYKIKEIYQKARELGLELCPAQVGPELCINYKNYIEDCVNDTNSLVIIAIEPKYDKIFQITSSSKQGVSLSEKYYGLGGIAAYEKIIFSLPDESK